MANRVILTLYSVSSDAELEYYDGDKELPLLSTVCFGYPAEKVARYVMNPVQEKVCHIQPLGVTKNATFILDIDDIPFSDIKADDLGVWKANGTKTTHFRILDDGSIMIASAKLKGPMQSYYRMTRRYYVHGTYNLFRRVIIDIRGKFNDMRDNYWLPTAVWDFHALFCALLLIWGDWSGEEGRAAGMDSPNELLFGVRLNQSGSLTILRHSFYYPPPPPPPPHSPLHTYTCSTCTIIGASE